MQWYGPIFYVALFGLFVSADAQQRSDAASGADDSHVGAPGAGSFESLRSATLSERHDTIDAYISGHTGAIRNDRKKFIVRDLGKTSGGSYEVSNAWFDSASVETALQSVRTVRGSLRTELETVRALKDSASMLVSSDHVTAWVVPQNGAPRFFDGAAVGERYAKEFVVSVIATSHPAIGAIYLAPTSSLYGSNPIQTQVDTIRVARRDSLLRGDIWLPVLVLERANGSEVWMDEATGSELLSRGNAGPTMWWWHIRRGITPPTLPN